MGIPLLPRPFTHLKSKLAISRQTHLGKKIEIVFADHDQVRADGVRSAASNPSAGETSVGSKSATGMPCSRSTAAASSVCSGGYGCIFSTCLRSREEMIAVSQQNAGHVSMRSLRVRLRGCPVSSERRTTSHCFAIESHSSSGQSKKWLRIRQCSGLRSKTEPIAWSANSTYGAPC